MEVKSEMALLESKKVRKHGHSNKVSDPENEAAPQLAQPSEKPADTALLDQEQ